MRLWKRSPVDSDADYLAAVIAARCGPEMADAVVPVEIVARIVEVIDAMQERLDGLAAAVGGLDEDRGLTSATPPYYSLPLGKRKMLKTLIAAAALTVTLTPAFADCSDPTFVRDYNFRNPAAETVADQGALAMAKAECNAKSAQAYFFDHPRDLTALSVMLDADKAIVAAQAQYESAMIKASKIETGH